MFVHSNLCNSSGPYEDNIEKMNEWENKTENDRARSGKANTDNENEKSEQNIDRVWRRGPNSFLPKQESSESDREWIFFVGQTEV